MSPDRPYRDVGTALAAALSLYVAGSMPKVVVVDADTHDRVRTVYGDRFSPKVQIDTRRR